MTAAIALEAPRASAASLLRMGRLGLVISAITLVILSNWIDAVWPDALPAILFALGLFGRPLTWLCKRTGQIAIVMAILAAVGWFFTNSIATTDFLIGASRYNGVIALLLCMPLLRLVFTRAKLEGAMLRLVCLVGCRLRLPALLATASCATLGLSFGTIGVLGACLNGRSRPTMAIPATIMRAVVVTMLWAPTTGSVAVVMATFPNISWGETLALALPLSLVALFLAAMQPGSIEAENAPVCKEGGSLGRLGLFVGLVLGATAVAHVGLSLPIIYAICVGAFVTTALWFFVVERVGIWDAIVILDDHFRQTWTRLSPEVALFLACGLMTLVAADASWLSYIDLPSAVPAGAEWLGLAVIIFGIPLFTVLGIHPLIPFTVLSSIVTASSLGLTDAGAYVMWIAMFMLSMLLSPVSVLNVTTAVSFSVPTGRLSLRTHWLYALAFGTAVIVFLRLFASVTV